MQLLLKLHQSMLIEISGPRPALAKSQNGYRQLWQHACQLINLRLSQLPRHNRDMHIFAAVRLDNLPDILAAWLFSTALTVWTTVDNGAEARFYRL